MQSGNSDLAVSKQLELMFIVKSRAVGILGSGTHAEGRQKNHFDLPEMAFLEQSRAWRSEGVERCREQHVGQNRKRVETKTVAVVVDMA
jgi:hypothetical protein